MANTENMVDDNRDERIGDKVDDTVAVVNKYKKDAEVLGQAARFVAVDQVLVDIVDHILD